MEKPKRVIGIDPGTRNVGYGIVESSGSKLIYVAGGCIKAKGDEMSQRLITIHTGLIEVIEKYSPEVAAIETVFAGNNVKTAIAIGEGRGAAVISAAEKGLAVEGYEPALVKRAVTGNGRANKEQVQEMVRILLGLPAQPETDHEA
ncbi:MAG: crossover junction endodeoxyribonuclease RuvC, partial [Planctomycetes bacterium]|nr:crossover junction endodeoxyribonuclease RuvC [Planctomycetota bacterium]